MIVSKVYLVGAGCGALELYTIKAMCCIQETDCLIYDHLVDQCILDYTKDSCEKIYVGKTSHHHTMKQEDINQLLLQKAHEYHHVVRLKGGDVYVFGRGGEEGQTLYENHIDFEVVPGISSAIGGLAYAGIPITHRGLSTGFQVYTAQLKQHTPRQFDFSTMLADDCTYVFLMAISKIDMIVDGFLQAGKKGDTPVAIISHASLPNQQCLVGTLATIQQQFAHHPLPTPGIIVVGQVVSMRPYLQFYEKLPLFSKNILVTSVGHDDYLTQRLRDLGAAVDQVKTGDILYQQCDIPFINGYLIFTSRHGVIGFMQNYLQQHHDLRKLAHTKIICIGQKTNQQLQHYGLTADYFPSHADSHYLNQELKNLTQNQEVYLAMSNQTNIQIHNHELHVYHNQETIIMDNPQHYDYGLFTCASSVHRFYHNNTSTIDVFVSIGHHTTKAIQECYGDVKIIEVSHPHKEEMIDIILRSEKNVL